MGHRAAEAGYARRGSEGEWKGGLQGVQHDTTPSFIHSFKYIGNCNSHHPRGCRVSSAARVDDWLVVVVGMQIKLSIEVFSQDFGSVCTDGIGRAVA